MKMVCVRTVVVVSLLLGSFAAQAETPTPKKPNDYLPVEDVPKRQDPSMTPDDRAKLVKELSAARDRQAIHAKPQDSAKTGKPK